MSTSKYKGQHEKARFSLFVVGDIRPPIGHLEFEAVKQVALALSKIMYKKK